MKIAPGNTSDLNSSKKIEKQPMRSEFDSTVVDNLKQDSLSQKSDFAGVLDRVTRSHNESSNRPVEGKSHDVADSHERKVKDEENVEGEASLVNVERQIILEPQARTEDTAGPRPILHSVDLDNMVTACQVNLGANGQHEVTLELSRSMLEGLRVKVSADGAGRIKADFLTANESIKALLDTRSAELIEQLRSRGINLAEYKTSVATDTEAGNFSSRREEQRSGGGENPAKRSEAVASGAESPTTEIEDVLANGATYRG